MATSMLLNVQAPVSKPFAQATRRSAPLSTAQQGRLQVNALRHAPVLPARSRTAVRVQAFQDEEAPTVVKVAESIGLPTEEGLFGFKPFPELWVGRLAMIGFLTSCVEEFITGRGTLGQIGFQTPDINLLALLVALSGGITLASTFGTVLNAVGGKLSPRDVARYRNFLGVQPDREIDAEAAALKRRGDFTSPTSLGQIDSAKREGAPIDSFLTYSDRAEADETAQQMKASNAAPNLARQEQEAAAVAAALKERETGATAPGPNVSLAARADVLEQTNAISSDMAYAKSIEMSNGRAAMLGFLAAVLVEAATGHGILGQVIMYLKWANILGVDSGF